VKHIWFVLYLLFLETYKTYETAHIFTLFYVDWLGLVVIVGYVCIMRTKRSLLSRLFPI